MNSEFEANLVKALEALEAGTPVEEILARYPEQARQLRPILETSAQLASLPIAHSLSAQATSRATFLKQAAALRDRGQQPLVAPISVWRRFVLSLASLAIFVVVLGGVIVGASQSSLPGQALYPVKRAVEGVRLSLASDPTWEEALQTRFRAERREEIYALQAAGLEGRVECEGMIERIDEDRWTLDGLVVEVAPATIIDGTPELGATARGFCRVEAGQVVAESLRIESQPQPTPTPTATPTDTVTPSPTATSTPTATGTPTAAPPAPSSTAIPDPAPPAQNEVTDDEEEDEEEEHEEEEDEEEEDDESDSDEEPPEEEDEEDGD